MRPRQPDISGERAVGAPWEHLAGLGLQERQVRFNALTPSALGLESGENSLPPGCMWGLPTPRLWGGGSVACEWWDKLVICPQGQRQDSIPHLLPSQPRTSILGDGEELSETPEGPYPVFCCAGTFQTSLGDLGHFPRDSAAPAPVKWDLPALPEAPPLTRDTVTAWGFETYRGVSEECFVTISEEETQDNKLAKKLVRCPHCSLGNGKQHRGAGTPGLRHHLALGQAVSLPLYGNNRVSFCRHLKDEHGRSREVTYFTQNPKVSEIGTCENGGGQADNGTAKQRETIWKSFWKDDTVRESPHGCAATLVE